MESNSVRGFTREELFVEEEPPAWVAEAEARFGVLRKSGGIALPGDRIIYLIRFARGWRLSLQNPANPPGTLETDIFLTPEGLEAVVLLAALLREHPVDPDHPYPALEAMIEQGQRESVEEA